MSILFPPAVIVQLATLQEEEVNIIKVIVSLLNSSGVVANPVDVVAYFTQC